MRFQINEDKPVQARPIVSEGKIRLEMGQAGEARQIVDGSKRGLSLG